MTRQTREQADEGVGGGGFTLSGGINRAFEYLVGDGGNGEGGGIEASFGHRAAHRGLLPPDEGRFRRILRRPNEGQTLELFIVHRDAEAVAELLEGVRIHFLLTVGAHGGLSGLSHAEALHGYHQDYRG